MIYIYGLYHDGNLRYIGQSKNARSRLNGHWSGRFNNGGNERWGRRINVWLRTLEYPPDMRILAMVENYDANRTEIAAISAAKYVFGTDQIVNGNGFGNNERWRQTMESQEFKGKISAISKEMWKDPDRRAARSAWAIQRYSGPEGISFMSEISRGRWSDPEARAAQAERTRLINEDEGHKERQRKSASEYHKDLWKDPMYVESHSRRMKKRWEDPEFVSKVNEGRTRGQAVRRARRAISLGIASPVPRQTLLEVAGHPATGPSPPASGTGLKFMRKLPATPSETAQTGVGLP